MCYRKDTIITPDVSIIVPIYKVPEPYLRKCIESITAQSLPSLEAILVDDGSPDRCGAICEEYASENNTLHVLHKENGGLSSARNAGVNASTGKWIMFVDGDDWIEPSMCEDMLHAGEEKNVQLVMCGISKDYSAKKVLYKFDLVDGKRYLGEECRWLQQQLLIYNQNIGCAYAKLIRRDLIKGVYHDEKLRQGVEGLEFNIRLFENLESATFINQPYYHYIYNDSSISASHSEENHELVINGFEKIKEFIKTSQNRENLESWVDNRLLFVIVTTAISGYFNPANTESYAEKKRKYSLYLQKPIVQEALLTKNTQGLGTQRKIILFMGKHRLFFLLNLMGKLRKWQKTHA